MKEEGEGALQEAIDIYSKIVENSSAERSLRAKAQLQIGLCYEKLGKKQATEAYNKVIAQFADQQQTAEIAKARLRSINSKIAEVDKNAPKSTVKQIVLDKSLIWNEYRRRTRFDFSPDGENFVYMAHSENSKIGKRYYVANIAGPPSTPLISNNNFEREITFPRYLPDGKNIGFRGRIEGQRFENSEFYFVNAKGGKPKQLSPKALIFSPDGKYHTMVNDNMLTIKNLIGETITTFSFAPETENHWITGISPDSKWISYTSVKKGENRNKVDCWLVSLSGDKHVRLTDSKGFDGYGTWSKNNYSFYFVSERNEDLNLYRLKINPDTGEKMGNAEQVTFYRDADVINPIFIEQKNALAYCLSKKQHQIVIPENENFNSFKTIATGTNPVMSPDGETVYFAGTGKDNQGIYSVPRTGGTKNKLTNLIPTDSYFSYNYFTLSPDGSTITFLTKKDDNNIELCFLSTDGGKLHIAITIETNQIVGRDPSLDIVPTWSPDSKKVAIGYNNTVYTIPVWGNIKEKLSDIKGWEQYSTKWSPNGKYIAGFVDDNDIGNLNVVIVSTQTGEIKKLTTNEEKEYKENLEWHPDGDKLTYFLYYNGEDGLNTEPDDADQIRIAYADGSPTAEIIDQPDVWDYTGVWDPTGSNYYFEGWRAETQQWQLNKFNIVSKEFILLPFIISDHELPSFSKDGKHIVIRKVKTENQLWMMEGVE